MKIAVVANDERKVELLSQGDMETDQLEWISEPRSVVDADVYMDLLFEDSQNRIETWISCTTSPVIISSVIRTLADIGPGFIRINAWPGFLNGPLVEASFDIGQQGALLEKVFSRFGKKITWVPDIPGFLAPRVVCMIINEAYFALADGVSTPEEIDIAMKLGTNYPYGPFEWGKKIGLSNVVALLDSLSSANKRYQPAELLRKAAETK
jgi:3-hydroxybutyryl-CoA dehydrogenase